MTASTKTNTTPFPWEKWAQIPKEEREAEMKEALKENYQAAEYFEADKTEAAANAEKKREWVITTYPIPPYGHGRWVCPQKDPDPVTGETVGNPDENIGGMYNRVTVTGGTLIT